MDQILNFVRMFLLVSLILFIVRGIVKNAHVRIKGIVYTSVSAFLLILALIAFFVDKEIGKQLLNNPWLYIFLMISAFIYVVYGTFLLLKSVKLPAYKKKKMVYTVRPKEEYTYVLYKHGSLIYLTKDKNTGISYKMKKTEFSDDIISRMNKSLGVKIIGDIEKLGIVNVKGEEKDAVYYCYIIEIEDPLLNESLRCVTSYDITTLQIEEIDRFIILNLLMGRPFQLDY